MAHRRITGKTPQNLKHKKKGEQLEPSGKPGNCHNWFWLTLSSGTLKTTAPGSTFAHRSKPGTPSLPPSLPPSRARAPAPSVASKKALALGSIESSRLRRGERLSPRAPKFYRPSSAQAIRSEPLGRAEPLAGPRDGGERAGPSRGAKGRLVR